MTTGGTTPAVTAWTRHLAGRGLRDATITAYTGWVDRLADWAGDDPATLTTDDLERWLAEHRHWKPNTHAKAVASVRYFYRWLYDTGRRGDNPAAALRPARCPTPVPDPCPESVYAAALASAHGQDWWRLRLAAETGMRRAELAACHSDDVRRLVTGPTLRVDGKGGRVRWIPLPEDLAAWLSMQRGYAFPVGDGHMAPCSVGCWFRRHLGVHVHMLRHRYATLAYHRTRDINAVRQLLGHSSAATTQIYIAVADEDLRAAAAGAWTDAA